MKLRSPILFLLAFALGLALAWARRDRSLAEADDIISGPAQAPETALASLKLPQTKSALLRERDGFKSAAAWLLRLENARAGDFPDLFLLAVDPLSNDVSELAGEAAERWAELDPEGMLAYFLGDGRTRFPGNDYFLYTGSLFETWAKSDPEAALAATGHFSNAGSFAWSVLSARFRENPEAGIAMINEHANLLGDLNYVPYFFREKDNAALFTAFARIENKDLRTALFGRVAMGFMQSDPENAWRWWRAADPSLQRDVADSLLRYGTDAGKFMTPEDISRLRSIASETRDSLLAAKVIRYAAESGGFDEPVGTTVAWVRANVHGHERQWALASLLGEAAGKDPAAALAAYESLPRGTERLQAIPAIAHSLGQTDPIAGLGWLNLQPPGEATSIGFSSLASSWVDRDWKAASTYALTMPESPTSTDFTSSVAIARFETDRAEAVAWSLNLTGERFERVSDGLINHWIRKKPADAMAFVDALPQGHQRSILFTSMANAYYHSEGHDAAPWLAGLQGNDRDLALKALDATGAPEDWKAKMRAAAQP